LHHIHLRAVGAMIFVASAGQAGGQHRIQQIAPACDAHPFVVHKCARAFFGVEEFVGYRVVRDTRHNFPLALKRNCDREQG
jgi:hypothetical protein